MCVSGAEDFVPSQLSGDNLANNVLVGETDDHAVFGSIVFVLCLADEALAGVVVCLSFSTTLVFDLIATVRDSVQRDKERRALNSVRNSIPIVSAVLDQLGERLEKTPESAIGASDSKPKHLAETHFSSACIAIQHLGGMVR